MNQLAVVFAHIFHQLRAGFLVVTIKVSTFLGEIKVLLNLSGILCERERELFLLTGEKRKEVKKKEEWKSKKKKKEGKKSTIRTKLLGS